MNQPTNTELLLESIREMERARRDVLIDFDSYWHWRCTVQRFAALVIAETL